MGQFTRFLELLSELEGRGITFPIRHCAASAAVLKYPCTHLDMVRPGVALYGHYPDPSCEGLDGVGLRPVMALKTRVASVKACPGCAPTGWRYSSADSGRLLWAVSAWTCAWRMPPGWGLPPATRWSSSANTCRWRTPPLWRAPSNTNCSAPCLPGCPGST